MYILGLSFFYHDSAACLIKDGKVIAAVQEERFSRIKHDAAFPTKSVEYCLSEANISIEDIDYVSFYEKPFIKFERILETYIKTWPRCLPQVYKGLPVWFKDKLWTPQVIQKQLEFSGDILFVKHHLSHAASSFFASPFKSAALLTMDGVGEWETTTIGTGEDEIINLTQAINFPHSLGLLYSTITFFLGFKVNGDEYKVMGLAPYGKPKYADKILKELIQVEADGSFNLNLKYFTFPFGLRMSGKKMEKFFGIKRRVKDSALLETHKDIAASIQFVLEEIVVKIANHIHKKTGKDYLCLSGGVALNCVVNGRLLKETPFKDIFVQPAAGDAGGALGAALYTYYSLLKNKNLQESWKGPYLGPGFSDNEIEDFLHSKRIAYKQYSEEDLFTHIALQLKNQKIVGWFQGRSEYGPRALGNRSILADPRDVLMKDKINSIIKFREDFRPFAPSIIDKRAEEYFDMENKSPYMLFTAHTKNDSLKAVTHLDGSARVQTVSELQNVKYFKLLKAFEDSTGCPALLNTSFNVRSEPIVLTPDDAYNCFKNTGLDVLVLGNFIIEK